MAKPGELLHDARACEAHEVTGLELVHIGPLVCVAQTHIVRDLLRADGGAEPHNVVAMALTLEVAAWQGALSGRIADPDGLLTEARFFTIPAAIALLDRLPFRPMCEPIVAYLRGDVVLGALWFYRSDARHADTLLVLRVP